MQECRWLCWESWLCACLCLDVVLSFRAAFYAQPIENGNTTFDLVDREALFYKLLVHKIDGKF